MANADVRETQNDNPDLERRPTSVKEALRMASMRASQGRRSSISSNNNDMSVPNLTNVAKQYQNNNQVSLDIENEEDLFSQVPKKQNEIFDYEEAKEAPKEDKAEEFYSLKPLKDDRELQMEAMRQQRQSSNQRDSNEQNIAF